MAKDVRENSGSLVTCHSEICFVKRVCDKDKCCTAFNLKIYLRLSEVIDLGFNERVGGLQELRYIKRRTTGYLIKNIHI